MKEESHYVLRTKRWIENVVLGLNLCPFAAHPFQSGKIQYIVNQEAAVLPITNDIIEAAETLVSASFVTSFIILPNIDWAFEPFYEFVKNVQDHLDQKLESNIVLVAFHPDFTYAENKSNDTSNATNRSPYPMVHLLSGESLDMAADSDIDIDELLYQNKSVLETMTWAQINSLYQ